MAHVAASCTAVHSYVVHALPGARGTRIIQLFARDALTSLLELDADPSTKRGHVARNARMRRSTVIAIEKVIDGVVSR